MCVSKMENRSTGMDEFCGFKFWDVNLTWYTDDPDFTDCFQKTVLIWTPCSFLWLCTTVEVYCLLTSERKDVPVTWLFISKFVLTLGLIVLTIIDLGKSIRDSILDIPVYSVNYVTPCIKILTFVLALTLLFYNKKYGMRSSGLLWTFWFILGLCGIVQFRSLLRKNVSEVDSRYEYVSYMIYFPIVVLSFLLNFLVDAEPKVFEYKSVDKPFPEQNASFPSRLIFGWFSSLVWTGFKRPLEISDLWSMDPINMAKEIVPQFDKYWNKSLKKLDNAKTIFRKSSGQIDITSTKKKKTISVLSPLWKAFGQILLFGVILKVVQDTMTFIGPQILKLLIQFVKQDEPLWKGFFYAVLLFLTATIRTLAMSQYFHRMFFVSLRMRTALIAAIYRKALRISNSSRKEATVGEIVNLMSVDVQRFIDVTTHVIIIWTAPLQIALALYFLWEILGPSVLSGLAVMIILIPINALFTSKIRNLQIKQMTNKDDRMKLMNEVLSGIKVLKLYAWEPSFEEQILKIRNTEIKVLKEAAYLNSGTSFLWSCAPFLVSIVSFATFVLMDENNILDSETAFVSLSLFNILRFPLSILPMTITNVIQASVSLKRINKFMNSEELDPDNVQHDQSEVNPLIIENGNFAWDSENVEKPVLRNINLQIKPGQLVAVVGTVGSGKSSLISALLGEMEKLSGRVNTKGSIAYVSQQAWIQNATLQNNILFGKTLEKAFYNRVIEACALTPDLKVLQAGDKTEIGENGINLSGGQKQRVSLARAVYNNSDVYLLDDPLSAVDSHVGKHIFDNLIGPRGLMKKKTRVLVTHGITYLPEVDNIIVLTDGEISESGTYKELFEKRGAFADFLVQHLQEVKPEEETEDLAEIKQRLESTIGSEELQQRISKARASISSSISESGSIADRKFLNGSVHRQYSTDSQQSVSPLHSNSIVKEKKQDQYKTGEKLIKTEKAATGSVKWKVYSHYLKSIGWFLALSTIIMNAILQSFSVGSNAWLSVWSDDEALNNKNSSNFDPSKQEMYLGVYGALGLGQVLSVISTSLTVQLGTLRSSRVMFRETLHNTLRGPMSLFDTVPIGRILSRFGADVDTMDNRLPLSLNECLSCLFKVIATLVVISYSTPIFIAVIIPIGLIYYLIQRFYIATSRQLKRLESVSRSPIYSHFGESVTGAQTIRAYGVEERFIKESENRVDFNQVCYCHNIISNRWLAVRLESVGNLIILFAALFAVLGRSTMNAGLVGLSISYALQITQTLNMLVRMTSDVETNLVAVERIKEYSETPQEAPWDKPENDPPKEWPSRGSVEFREYKVCYREGLDLVLNGLSFNVGGGEKIGIVGRTGAGKSSLALALFRIIEAAGGEILIDNVDISKLGLHTLRSQLTIIPQDAVLFSGTVRLNLDPFNKCSDDDLWRALAHAHLKEFVQSLPNGLDHQVTEGGDNLSAGQKQLICLARALLRKTKVLILDEATAAVDLETDDLIQRTIREEFKECTVLTIAHRLNTILDSDRVVVLDKGSIVEFDAPDTLLQKQESFFYGMAKDAGLTLS